MYKKILLNNFSIDNNNLIMRIMNIHTTSLNNTQTKTKNIQDISKNISKH